VSVPVSGIALEEPLTLGGVDLLLTGPAQSSGDVLVQPDKPVPTELLDRYLQGPVWAKTLIEATSLVEAERTGILAINDALAWFLLLTRYSLSVDPFGELKDYDHLRSH